MFSTRATDKYKATTDCVSEDFASEEVTEAQAAMLKTIIDGNPVPKAIEQKVFDSAIELDTFRDAVRYAQDRCAAVLIACAEQDLECEKLGMPEEYGVRYDFYRRIIENKGGKFPFPRGLHIGDETWLYNAPVHELMEETKMCVNERYYMEATWANMDKFIKCHKGLVMQRDNGLGRVYKKPEPKVDEDGKSLVKWTGGLRTARLGRTGRGGRGGGSVGRAEGSSFRGWK